MSHQRAVPEAGEVMIHGTGDGHLALNIILRESLLDIFWSDLIARPIHQRVSVPANCPLIVPGVSIVTREDLSNNFSALQTFFRQHLLL